jgi:arylsulfatase A-like enzyme
MRACTKALLSGLIATLTVPACGGAAEPSTPRNLILIVMDTCRRDRASDAELSPALAALARDAVVFADCLAQSTSTGPSHKSMFTGWFVHRHGQTANDDPRVTAYDLPRLMHAAGFRTAAFVGGGALGERLKFNDGFEVYRDMFDFGALKTGDPGKGRLGSAVDAAAAWIDGLNGQRFFAFVHGFDPHCPYWPRADLREARAGWYRGTLDPRGKCASMGYGELLNSGAIGPDEWRYLNDLYDAGVAEGDEAIGRLVALLGERGLLDDTLLVFTSDHGESLGERGVLGHGQMWEEQIEVPLLMRFPHAAWAGRRDDPVQHVDLAPTILSAFALRAPAGVQGVDLMPRIRAEAAPLGERLRVTEHAGTESVRFDGRWKLVLTRAPGGIADRALFDLSTDPGEASNLAETPDGRARFEEMLTRYEAWRAETAAEDRYWRGGASLDALSDDDRRVLESLGYAGRDG